jgi:hypothetical protein
VIPGVPQFFAPLFFASLLGEGPDLSREKSSPRPSTTAAPAPTSPPARPLNAQPSKGDDIAARAFRDACRDCDARGVEPIRAGASR